MKIIVIAVCLALLGGAWFVLNDREGRVFKKLTKIIRPMMSQPVVSGTIISSYSDMTSKLLTSNEWQWYQPQFVKAETSGNAISFEIQEENVWWRNWRVPYLYSYIDGDVDVSISVKTRKRTDGSNFPDKGYQFGGIMLRDPLGDNTLTSESYVFNVVGYRGEKLQVETKSTVGGWSQVDAFDWPTGDAYLRIVRSGSKFSLFAKASVSDEWRLVQDYDRPDLPSIMQIGLIAYAYNGWNGYHDLTAYLDELNISKPK